MATIPDIIVPNDSYLDLYDEAGLVVGTAIEIINKGATYVYIQESATQPDADSIYGTPITPLKYPNAVADISSGSDSIWVRSSDGRDGRVSVIVIS